jgi:hypothetical protein
MGCRYSISDVVCCIQSIYNVDNYPVEGVCLLKCTKPLNSGISPTVLWLMSYSTSSGKASFPPRNAKTFLLQIIKLLTKSRTSIIIISLKCET